MPWPWFCNSRAPLRSSHLRQGIAKKNRKYASECTEDGRSVAFGSKLSPLSSVQVHLANQGAESISKKFEHFSPSLRDTSCAHYNGATGCGGELLQRLALSLAMLRGSLEVIWHLAPEIRSEDSCCVGIRSSEVPGKSFVTSGEPRDKLSHPGGQIVRQVLAEHAPNCIS